MLNESGASSSWLPFSGGHHLALVHRLPPPEYSEPVCEAPSGFLKFSCPLKKPVFSCVDWNGKSILQPVEDKT
eukprot:CAMPEP_0172822058 /NCGR_PEP_ID=MMETSP1075-20121228/16418_1 /TAXON_ID=2916 /ORGANISM="Ceratium fusus, Strain PA161109" /LENGTH=72 /DNA_ID=CAMNT_0013663003 /DNA_START=67 /DNA_END=281 /DNA_ORIENTATION=+